MKRKSLGKVLMLQKLLNSIWLLIEAFVIQTPHVFSRLRSGVVCLEVRNKFS